MEKIFANHVYDKGFVHRIQKELSTQNIDKGLNFQNWQKTWITFLQGGCTKSHEAHEKLVGLISQLGTANPNHTQTPPPSSQDGCNQRQTIASVSKDVEKRCRRAGKWYNHFGETVWQFLRGWNMKLAYDPAVPLLGIHKREMKTYNHTKTYVWMFIVVLFIKDKKWKSLKYSLVDD